MTNKTHSLTAGQEQLLVAIKAQDFTDESWELLAKKLRKPDFGRR